MALRIFSRTILRLSQKFSDNQLNNKLITATTTWFRFKYTQNIGVKGLTNRKSQFTVQQQDDNDETNDGDNDADRFDLDDKEYDILASSMMNITKDATENQKVFIIQPYIKWGPKKSSTNPDLQLQEAEALIRSIPEWSIEISMKVPLESLEKKSLFGTGKMKELKEFMKKSKSQGKEITCIFISKGTLSFIQKRFLQSEFGVKIMDRYSVVIQILRLHAISAEAKLQVAMAEIPYIWGQMKDANPSTTRKQGYSLSDSQKELLNKRERKLKKELESIRKHRKLLRSKRQKENYPIVAVIGYTNAGKTSLIKALTDEQTIQPRDQLFATLDVTAHAGILPCRLEVIYMDTVGFMSDIPTDLIECFIATLEDAMLSDVIIHVQDLSHENCDEQRRHVENTIKSLIARFSTETEINENIKNPPPIINVGNKIDLMKDPSTESILQESKDLKLVSSKTFAGINDLVLEIESKLLEATDRLKIVMRVRNGGEEMSWLYKNAAVTNSRADPNNEESILLDIVIHKSKLQIFKHHFVGSN